MTAAPRLWSTMTPDELTARFSDHQIRRRASGERFAHWDLWRRRDDKWSVNLRSSIVAQPGILVVYGDYYPTMFRGGGDDPVGQVKWMCLPSPGDRYFTEKATIGTGRSAVWSFDPDDAIEDLRELIAREEDDGDRSVVEACRRGIEAAHYGPSEMFAEIQRGYSGCMEVFSCLGERPSAQVCFAWGAIRRLAQLLDAEAA